MRPAGVEISSLDETLREVRACDSCDVVAVWRRRRRPRALPHKHMSQAAQPDGRWAPMHDRPFAEAVPATVCRHGRHGFSILPGSPIDGAASDDDRRPGRR
jgi:hypothetical protein